MNEMHGGPPLWQIIGWIAFALNVWGNLALTTKGLRGWIIRIGSNACWIPYGVLTGAWALTANHGIFILINAWGWYKWRREELLKARIETPGETAPYDAVQEIRRLAYVKGFDAGRKAANF